MPDGVRSFQDSSACVFVPLLLKFVMLPGAGASSVSEVCIKTSGAASTKNFAKEDADREARNLAKGSQLAHVLHIKSRSNGVRSILSLHQAICLRRAEGEVDQVWEDAKVKVGAVWKVCMEWKVLQGHASVGDASIRAPP